MVLPIKTATFPVYEAGGIAKKPGAGGAGAAGGIGGIGGGQPGIGRPQAPDAGKVDFSEKLREVLEETNSTQVKAETAAQDYASGKQNDLHGTMITMTEADVSLRLVANVRNKVIEAYREVMRMGS